MGIESIRSSYVGDAAANYDAERADAAKWRREQDAIRHLLDHLPSGLRILDCPIGTGRFLELYAPREYQVLGIDISEDMLARARERASALGIPIALEIGDIRRLPLQDGAVDLVVCIRLLNWVSRDELGPVVAELARASRQHVVVGIRHKIPVRDMGLALPILLGGRLALWLWRRIRPATTIHHRIDVATTFKAAGLDVIQSELIERALTGTEYRIYLLRKA